MKGPAPVWRQFCVYISRVIVVIQLIQQKYFAFNASEAKLKTDNFNMPSIEPKILNLSRIKH